MKKTSLLSGTSECICFTGTYMQTSSPHTTTASPQVFPLPILHSDTVTLLPSSEKLSGRTTTPMSACKGNVGNSNW